MAYEASHGSHDAEKERNVENNAQNINNAADVAIASKNPYGVAAGMAVKGANALTNGNSSRLLGKGVDAASRMSPFGKKLQNLSNGINESGLGDRIGKASRMGSGLRGGQSGMGGGQSLPSSVSNNRGVDANDEADSAMKKSSNDGDEDSSLFNKSSKNNGDANKEDNGELDNKNSKKSTTEGSEEEQSDSTTLFGGKKDNNSFFGKISLPKIIIIGVVVFIIFLLLFITIIVSTIPSFLLTLKFGDALGISSITGGSTGNLVYQSATTRQEEFYQRVNNVKLEMQARGRTLDGLKIAAVYYVLRENGSSITYEDMTEPVITYIADMMFDGNEYSEERFRSNLINAVFPTFLPSSSFETKEQMVDKVFDYVDNYYDYIGEDPFSSSSSDYTLSTCSSGNCTYNIKGFYVKSRGNVSEKLQLSNLYVRLMQCGSFTDNNGVVHNYGGTFGQPLAGEELVPFETYVLGVAYGEHAGAKPEAFKAQLIAARSYILSRHLDGGWRTLKKEGDKWVIQAASCTLDQVFCNPDKGCSSDSGQWGQIHSGLSYNKGYKKEPLDKESPLRTYASQTYGEVLVNQQGYIIRTSYNSTLQKEMDSYANKNMSYKQILLQAYNQGDYNFGATDIQKNSCEITNCPNSGYRNWKQYEGSWTSVTLGNSGKTIKQIGCLATSVAIQIARSGVQTSIADFNPGTFVQKLNKVGGFVSGGNFYWPSTKNVAPSFIFQDRIDVSGFSKEQKLNKIKELTSQKGIYVVAEVKGSTGQHWVAIDSVNGDKVTMMDPGSKSTDLWGEYNWANTSTLAYFKAS
ncbi:MAG: hypothetical protein IJJ63_01835 [Bacilli bacterium]|nr:hypothetical protein [Bacilli bacterium]